MTTVCIPYQGAALVATMVQPLLPPRAVLVGCHGLGSDRHSLRNNTMALRLADELACLSCLMTVRTLREMRSDVDPSATCFDIAETSERIAHVARWLSGKAATFGLPLFLFGASLGAASAFRAAATHDLRVSGIISRAGRLDLVASMWRQVPAPLLIVVGDNDPSFMAIARNCEKRRDEMPTSLRSIAGASHLFSERGTLKRSIDEVCSWIARLLPQEC